MEATRTCSEKDCDRPRLARGLCQRHYWLATKDQQRCKADGCARYSQSLGLCQTHAETDPDHPRCTYPGCARALRTAGLCFGHYERKKKGEELRPFVDWTQVPCRGPLCKRMARYNTGYCVRHHIQMREHGEVWVIGTRRGRTTRPVVCVEVGCESTKIAVRGRCYAHISDDQTTCWLPWCTSEPSTTSGLCEPHRGSHNRLMHFYGIGWPERLRLSEEQGAKCAICGAPDDIENGAPVLHVDHCHATGRVRGLLCGACNRGLGLMRDNVELLQNAIAYIERTTLEENARI